MLDPREIENKRFTVVRLREGYAQNEVDDFIDKIAENAREVLAELAQLKDRAQRLSNQDDTTQFAKVNQASRILELAEHAAREEAEKAKAEGEQIIQGARDAAAAVTREANSEAERILSEGKAEKHRVLGELEDQRRALEEKVRDLTNVRDRTTGLLRAALDEIDKET